MRAFCNRGRILFSFLIVICTLCVIMTDVSDVENIGKSYVLMIIILLSACGYLQLLIC